MSSHRINKTWLDRLKAAVPFGIGQTKPKHFRDMAKVVWQNRDNLPGTASSLSLVELLSGLSIAGGLTLRGLRRRTAEAR